MGAISKSTIGTGFVKPGHLIDIECNCGNKLFVAGNNWIINFKGDVDFECSCGNVIKIEPSMYINTDKNVGI